jgi:hypothetical protein
VNSGPPVSITDVRDPRIRITFADVAMRIARDGPMYGVILLVGVLAMRGTTSALESILGAAFALQARSHPPPETDKTGRQTLLVGGLVLVAATASMHFLGACSAPSAMVLP